jgi:hypothetical protein
MELELSRRASGQGNPKTVLKIAKRGLESDDFDLKPCATRKNLHATGWSDRWLGLGLARADWVKESQRVG